MPTWTSYDLAQFLGRGLHTQRALDKVASSPDSREASLHEFILEEVGRRGWLAFHGSMAHRTHRTRGEPDFVILVDGGRLLLLEAKSNQGKPSPEQRARISHARQLGHTIHLIRTQREFLALARTYENQSPEGLRTVP